MKNNYKKFFNVILICMTAVYPMLFIFQGLDFTDTGYCLTCYRQIFNDPKCISMSFSVWLANVIGGLWLKVFGCLGLFGVRAGGAVITLAVVFLVYKLLNEYIDKTKLLAFIFLTMVLCYNRGMTIIHYDNLSALFYILGIYLMYFGLKNENMAMIFFSGFTAVSNIFIRLPNILQVFIVLGIFYWGIRKKIKLKKQMQYVIVFTAGCIAAFAILILAMKCLNQQDIFVSSIKGIEKTGESSSDSHGIMRLIIKFYRDNIVSIKSGAVVALFLALVYFMQKGLCKLKCSKIISSAVVSAASAIFICLCIYNYDYRMFLCSFIGISYFAVFYGLIKYRKNVEYSFIMFLSVFFLLGVPAGSDNGFYNTVYSLYMIMPIAFSIILSIFEKRQMKFEKNYFMAFAFIILAAAFLKYNYNFTYRDSHVRTDMKYKVQSKYLCGIYTNKERAQDVTELLQVLPGYAKPNDYLLAFSSIPMVHYLTGTRPYLYNSWPGLYTSNQFECLIEKAQIENTKYPVVLKQKIISRRADWPKDNSVDDDNKQELMETFLKNNKYDMVWNNRSFEIYIHVIK